MVFGPWTKGPHHPFTSMVCVCVYVCVHMCTDDDSMGQCAHHSKNREVRGQFCGIHSTYTWPPGNKTQVARFTWQTPLPTEPSCYPVPILQIPFIFCSEGLCSQGCVRSLPDLIWIRRALLSHRLPFVVTLSSVWWVCGIKKA